MKIPGLLSLEFMTLRLKIIYRIIIFLFIIILSNCNESKEIKNQPEAIKGVLDLREWDFEKDGPVNLNGEWEFYWKALFIPDYFESDRLPAKPEYVKVPSVWNGYAINNEKLSGDGYATYRLIIKTKKNLTITRAIRFTNLSSAYIMWVNGKGVIRAGKVGRKSSEHEPNLANAFFRLPELSETQENYDKIEIVLQISNFSHSKGGLWSEMVFGDEPQIIKIRNNYLFTDLFHFGILVALGLYHFVIFSLRRKDLSPLYYGLFCLMVSINLISQRERVLYDYFSVPWSMNLKIDYLSFYIVIPIFVFFIHSLFPNEIRKLFINIVAVTGLALSMIVIFTDAKFYTLTEEFFEYFSVACGVYCLFGLFNAVYQGRDGAVLFVISFVILFSTFIIDIFNEQFKFSIPTLTPSGLLVFSFFSSDYSCKEIFNRIIAF